MISFEKQRRYNQAIEEYRHAFWLHVNPDSKYKSTYKALVYRDISITHAYRYVIYDTWINTNKPGAFHQVRSFVPNLYGYSIDPEEALKQLLRSTRELFNNNSVF